MPTQDLLRLPLLLNSTLGFIVPLAMFIFPLLPVLFTECILQGASCSNNPQFRNMQNSAGPLPVWHLFPGLLHLPLRVCETTIQVGNPNTVQRESCKATRGPSWPVHISCLAGTLQISKKRNSFFLRQQTFYCTKQQECLLVRIICKIFRFSIGGFRLLVLTILIPGGKRFEAKVQSALLPKQIFFPTT